MKRSIPIAAVLLALAACKAVLETGRSENGGARFTPAGTGRPFSGTTSACSSRGSRESEFDRRATRRRSRGRLSCGGGPHHSPSYLDERCTALGSIVVRGSYHRQCIEAKELHP
jgi:hypothetical protein